MAAAIRLLARGRARLAGIDRRVRARHAGVLILVAILCATAPVAFGGELRLSVFGGPAIPLGATADTTSTGYAVGISVESREWDRFGLGLELACMEPSRKGDEDIVFTSLMTGVRGRYQPAGWDPGRPYLTAGAGVYMLLEPMGDAFVRGAFGDNSSPPTPLSFGLSGGAGVVLVAGRSAELALESSYHHLFSGLSRIEETRQHRPLQCLNITLKLSWVRERRAKIATRAEAMGARPRFPDAKRPEHPLRVIGVKG